MLDDLIPVTIANNGAVISISKTVNNWYNYNQKKWVNVVLVTASSRSTYQNSTGVTIPESNILTYYVWMPRYKYKIWTTGTSATGQEIDVIFETKDTTKSTGTQIGECLTYPAFTFGSDELFGIWVGKFETTGTASQPTIKLNAVPLTNQTVFKEFISSLKFAGGTSKTNGISFPESKYYNVYKASSGTTISALTACNGGYCYGHAFSEIFGWYSDETTLVSSLLPWVERGGGTGNGISAGVFYSSRTGGGAEKCYGFHTALLVE